MSEKRINRIEDLFTRKNYHHHLGYNATYNLSSTVLFSDYVILMQEAGKHGTSLSNEVGNILRKYVEENNLKLDDENMELINKINNDPEYRSSVINRSYRTEEYSDEEIAYVEAMTFGNGSLCPYMCGSIAAQIQKDEGKSDGYR